MRTALLYRVDLAVPKRPATAAQLAALERALAARRVCRTDRGGCGQICAYEPPRRFELCLDCLPDDDLRTLR